MINYYLQKTLDCDNEMTDDEKKAMEARIESKLKRGKKLSAKEMEYLKKIQSDDVFKSPENTKSCRSC